LALRSVITAGVHKASSVKLAEATKIIENTSDLNIALVSKVSLIFQRIGIDMLAVLTCANSKVINVIRELERWAGWCTCTIRWPRLGTSTASTWCRA